MIVRRCRFLKIISTVSCISSFGFVLAITSLYLLKSGPLDQLSAYNGDFLYDSSADNNQVRIRNTCYSDSLGIPPSLVGSQCLEFSCRSITCDKLFAGDPAAIGAARIFLRKSLSDYEVHRVASKCRQLQIVGKYQMVPVRIADVDFPVAFTLLVHLNAEQFERLLRAIYRPQNVYCVHVDAKSPASFQSAVKAVVNCFHNVFLATHLHRVVYAGPSRLQADIDCMKDLLARKVQWRYLINVPGQAYPLRTPEEMVDILRIYNGTNDIEGIHDRKYRHRYSMMWEEYSSNGTLGIRKTGRENSVPPHEMEIVRGSAYGIFSRKFVEFVVNDERANDLLEWSQYTYSPDEHYWATLHHTLYNPHLHTPGGYSGVPDNRNFMAVYVKWSNVKGTQCAGKYIRWICVLGVGDLPYLLPRPEFFVNKFDLDYQPLAFECAELWLRHRARCPVKFDTEFYRRLSFVAAHYDRLSI